MAIDKIFDGAVDGIADNLFNSVSNSVSEIKAMQQRKAAENVQLVVQALKKIDADIREKYDGVTETIEKRVANIKDGRDGIDGKNGLDGVNGKDGRDGKDGRNGRDGLTGPRGFDGPKGADGKDGQNGEDGVSITDAHIDFDGSLIISLSSGRVINVGEVVAADIAEKIKVITNGGGTSQPVLDQLASLQAQIDLISSALVYKGTWNASTNTPTLTSSAGTANTFYIVSVAGTTTLNGTSNWGVGDWAVYNGTVWQRIEGGAVGNFTDLSVSGTTTLSGLTASTALALNASKQVVSVTNTGSGSNVLATSPTLVTPVLGTPSSVTLTNATGLPLSTGVTGTLPIANGGTGQTTATNAFTALAPSQTGNSGKYLTTNGTSASWATVASGTVTSVSGTGTVNGLTLTGTVTTSGSLILGGTLSGISNASLTNSSITINGTATSLGGSISVGTVTSVAATVPSFLSITGSPITSSGTLAISLSGTALPTTSGGTGLTSFTANGVVYASSSSALTTGSALTFDGSKLVNTGYNKSTYQVSTNNVGTFESVGAAYLAYDSVSGANIYSRSGASTESTLNFRASTFSFKIGGTQVSSLDSSSFSLYNTPFLLSGSTSGYTGFAAPATSNYTIYTLPSADGTSGQSLVTNGSGTLSWASGTGGTVTSVSGTGTVSGISLSGTVTSSGSLTLGGSLDLSAYNGAGAFTTLSASSTVTLSGGTANGVAYLNGSKVVTSGSALTFDGTVLRLNGSTTSGFRLASSSGASNGFNIYNDSSTDIAYLNNYYNGSMVFGINNTEQMRLTSTGLGIGTSSPATKLHVSGQSRVADSSNAANYMTFGVGANAPYGNASISTTTAGLTIVAEGAGNMTFLNNGSERMRIDTSGNLGIGTSSPSYKLHVAATDVTAGYFTSSAAATTLTINNTNANAWGGNLAIATQGTTAGYFGTIGSLLGTTTQDLAVYATAGNGFRVYTNGNNLRATIDSSGNLGLGVTPSAWSTSAQKALQVYLSGVSSNGGGNTASRFTHGCYLDGSTWKYQDTGVAPTRYEVTGANGGSTHSWSIAAGGTAGNAITFTQAMTLTAAGKLFVNTTSGFIGVSNVKVDVAGRYNSGISGVGSYSFGAADGGGAFVINDTSNGSTEVERMRINSSGNVGIGQTSPAYKLDVFGTTPAIRLIANGVGNGVKLEQSSATGDVELNVIDGYALKFATSNTERARIDSSGNLLVGTTSNGTGDKVRIASAQATSTTLSLVSTDDQSGGTYVIFRNSAQTAIASIARVATTNSVSYNTTSDYRLKTITGNVTGQGARIDALKPVDYLWKEGNQQARGFLAHEFQTVYPNSVTGDKDAVDADGNPVYQAMQASTAEVIADLVAEIQSLRKRLADAGI